MNTDLKLAQALITNIDLQEIQALYSENMKTGRRVSINSLVLLNIIDELQTRREQDKKDEEVYEEEYEGDLRWI